MTVRPLIEQWFPAEAVGAESLRERGTPKAFPPINFLHVWWARRPLACSRATILASLLPAWPSDEEAANDADAARALKELAAEFPDGEDEYHRWFLTVVGILGDPVRGRSRIAAARETGERLQDGGYGYQRAFTRNPSEEETTLVRRLATLRGAAASPPVVLDPFAGGGSIPFEAARWGMRSQANELNPVAAAILTGTVDLPFRLGEGFSHVIRDYGTQWARRVEKRLDAYFPRSPGETVIAYIWAHTVPCPETGRPTPLAPDYWLARGKAGRDVAIRLEADPASGHFELSVVEGSEATQYGSQSTYKSGTGTSIWTGQTFSGKYIVERAQAGEMGEMLLAVSVTLPGKSGRQFRAPTADDLEAVEAAKKEADLHLSSWEVNDVVPSEAIEPGKKTNEPRRMGLVLWRQLFTPRQLLTIVTSLEELHVTVGAAKEEIGLEEAKALALYLAFALDKAIDYNSMLASWHSSRMMIRNTFDRHDFSFKWSFVEFDGAHALIPWAVENAAMNHTKISALIGEQSLLQDTCSRPALVQLGSATALQVDTRSVDAVITDPPYSDNVMYGECSDYFLVWLRRSLRDTWPEFCQLSLSDKQEEAVANSSLFETVATKGRGKKVPEGKTATDLAEEHYKELMTRAFAEAHRVLKDDGVMTVMFTHKKVEAWDSLGQSLLNAGFSINSSWPVHTESEHSLHQAKKNAASSTILLSCRKRHEETPAYWSEIKGEVARTARETAAKMAADGMHGIDLTLATFGPVLSVLSKNWPVYTGTLDAEGNSEVIRPDVALDLAREEVALLKKRGLLGGRSVDFDRVTDWWLLAWSDFQAAEFPAGEALKLSLATHLELDDLKKTHKVIKATTGTVTILSPPQRRTAKAFDPASLSWPTMLDALHSLMVVYEEDGAGAARAWLARTGNDSNPKFRDLVLAAINAVPRTRDKGEFARPEAKTLEGIRITLFGDIPAPVEDLGPVVVQLDFGGVDEEGDDADDDTDE